MPRPATPFRQGGLVLVRDFVIPNPNHLFPKVYFYRVE